jgi:PhnB protein
MAEVSPIPDGYHSVTPYLIVGGASDAIDFYAAAFGTKERVRVPGPGGLVGHAELELGDAIVMLADEYPEMGVGSPRSIGGSAVIVHIYVDDVDATFERAVGAGAEVLQAPEDKFYGDRGAQVRDPFGHVWSIATHIEDVAAEEMQRRAAAMTEASG